MKQVVGKLGTACQSQPMTGFKHDKVPERLVALIVICLSCSKSAHIPFQSFPSTSNLSPKIGGIISIIPVVSALDLIQKLAFS